MLAPLSARSVLLFLLAACGDKDPGGNTVEGDDTGDTSGGDDTGGEASQHVCSELGLLIREFSAEGPAAFQRHQPAGDFSVPLRDGSTWTLSEQWSGCESYIFLPHWLPTSDQDPASYWETGVEELIARSPRNAHYFFVVASSRGSEAETYGAAMQADIDAALAGLDAEEAEWWLERLHVVSEPSVEVEGLVGDSFYNDAATMGWAIDREQKIRTLGSMAAVEAYDAGLSSAGLWPWEARLYSAAAEAEYFNYEAERQAALDAIDATVVEVFGGAVIAEYEDGTLTLPDAATMAGFDTLEIDVRMECPDRDAAEFGNCGAWDYLAGMWLYDEPSKSWVEMGRFITTYHRESRWVVDASHALAWLGEGGTRTVRYSWAPKWNTQPTGVTLRVRLSNQGKGMAPREIVPLFTGGGFSSTYNADRPPVEVSVPADAKKVEVVSIVTGHGMDTRNCAEFCNHGHHFTVGGQTWSQEFDEAGTEAGCAETVGSGTVPNQGGTWWFGRGGWCPGRQVDPFVADITGQVTPGSKATIAYEATLDGGAPIDGAGNIEMRSWMVVHR